MQKYNPKQLSLSLHQDYILGNYKDSFHYHTMTTRQQQPPKRNLSPIYPRQTKQPRQIPLNLDVYIDQLAIGISQGNSKIKPEVYNTMFYDYDELKQSRKKDQSYTHYEKKRHRSTINPSSIIRNNQQETFQQDPENFQLQTSRRLQKKQINPLKVYCQTEIELKKIITTKQIQMSRQSYRETTNIVLKTDIKFYTFKNLRKSTLAQKCLFLIQQYFKVAQQIKDDYQAQKAKIDHFNSLKTAFQIDRKLNDNYIQKMKEWTAPAFQKILYYMEKNYEYKADDELIDSEKIKDQEEIWCLNYAKFLFQNIELITRKGNIPIDIIKEVSRAIQITSNTYMPLFLAKRIKFQNSPLSKSEYQLIAGEFIYFNIILSQFFDQSNKVKYQTLKHNLQQKIKIIELASIIHIYFIKYFVKMPQREDISDKKLYQRKLHISGDKNQELILIDTRDISLQETIVIGLKSEDHIKKLLKKKENLSKILGKLFDKTIQNIYSQIEIYDNIE